MAEEKQSLKVDFESEGVDNFLGAIEKVSSKLKEMGSIEPLRVSRTTSAILDEVYSKLTSIQEKASGLKIEYIADPNDISVLSEIGKGITSISNINAELLTKLDSFIDKLSTISTKAQEYEEVNNAIDAQLESQNKQVNDLNEKQKKLPENVERYNEKLAGTYKNSALVIKELSKIKLFEKGFRKYAANMLQAARHAEKHTKAIEEAKKANEKNTVQWKQVYEFSKNAVESFQQIRGVTPAIKLIKKLFGEIKEIAGTLFPLIALAGIASFAKEMIEVDKDTKALHRSLLQLAATQNDIITMTESFNADEMIKSLDTMKFSMLDFAKKWGVSFDEAKGRVESLVGAGIGLADVMGDLKPRIGAIDTMFKGSAQYPMKLGDEIAAMATYAGKSFSEMAADIAQWRNEFGISLDSAHKSFVQLRLDAAETGLMTNKFFERVLNASSGLVIYGTKLTDVSDLFADLTKSINLPREKAAELAQSLIKGVDQFDDATKVMLVKSGGGLNMLLEQITDIDQQIAKARNSEDKALEKRLKAEKSRLQGIMSLKDDYEKSVRIAEALDPTRFFQLRVQALAKNAKGFFGDIDLANPKELLKVFNAHGVKLRQAAEHAGFSPQDILTIENLTKKQAGFVDSVTSLSKSLNIGEEALSAAITKGTPDEIAAVLQSKFKGLTGDQIRESFKNAGLSDIIENLDLSNENMPKALKVISDKLSAQTVSLYDLGKPDETQKTIEELTQEQLKKSAEIAKSTTALADTMQNQLLTVNTKIYQGVRVVGKWTKTIWDGIKKGPKAAEAEKEALLEEKMLDLDNSLNSMKRDLITEQEKEKNISESIKDVNEKLASAIESKDKTQEKALKEQQKILQDQLAEQQIATEHSKKIIETAGAERKEIVVQKEITTERKDKSGFWRRTGRFVGKPFGAGKAFEELEKSREESNRRQLELEKKRFAMEEGMTEQQADAFAKTVVQSDILTAAIENYNKVLEENRKKYKSVQEGSIAWISLAGKSKKALEELEKALENTSDESLKSKHEIKSFEEEMQKLFTGVAKTKEKIKEIPLSDWVKKQAEEIKGIKSVETDKGKQVIKFDVEDVDAKNFINQLIKFAPDKWTLKEPGVLIHHSPVPFTFSETPEIVGKQKLNIPKAEIDMSPISQPNFEPLKIEKPNFDPIGLKVPEIKPAELIIKQPEIKELPAKEIINGSGLKEKVEKQLGSTVNNYYNTVTIPVKNGDPNIIETIVRQVLFEQEYR